MLYTAAEILLWMLLAFVLGALVAWLLGRRNRMTDRTRAELEWRRQRFEAILDWWGRHLPV